MRPALLTLLILLVAAGPARAERAATVRTTQCEAGTATFSAQMRALPGADRLQIRFTLQARSEEEPAWTAVPVPGFGIWNTSHAGIRRYLYAKTVEDLIGPARYRVRVRFRWLSADGAVLERERRTSRVCRQRSPD